MIEVASYPNDLGTWKADEDPFYLELLGETSPIVDDQSAEVVPAVLSNGSPASASAPIYEYWWTLGHPGHPHQPALVGDLMSSSTEARWPWEDLDNPAARIYMYFPIEGGWRIRELAATVKYLTPAHQQEEWWAKAAEDTQKISAVAGDLSKLTGLVPNPAFTGASVLLSAIAKLQINNVPQTKGFDWSVGKVTYGTKEHGLFQGVMWTLPRTMFTELGGRLTGSLALSFTPVRRQDSSTLVSGDHEYQARAIRAHAVVYHTSGRRSPIPKEGSVELLVRPHAPAQQEPRPVRP